MKRIFLDTNVCFDLFFANSEFHSNAAKIFALAYDKKIKVFVNSLSFANLHYSLRKNIGKVETMKKLIRLESWVEIVSVNKASIKQSLSSDFKDFEDAIQYYSALEAKLKIIVTRNLKDFKTAKIPVLTPADFLQNYFQL